MSHQHKVAVIGGGAWGLALAAAAARAESDVVLLSRRELNGSLPKGVRIVREMKQAAEHARLIVLAVPSGAARSVTRELGDHVQGDHYVVHGVRGLVHDSGGADDLRTILRGHPRGDVGPPHGRARRPCPRAGHPRGAPIRRRRRLALPGGVRESRRRR